MNYPFLPIIPAINHTARELALAHQNDLTKPPGSLGRLEELAVFYAGTRGRFPIPTPTKAFIPVFASDHGVAADKVSAFPPSLSTPIMQNVVDGGSGVCVLARQFDVELLAVDVGLTGDLVVSPKSRVAMLNRKIRRGSRNLRVEDAMSEEEAQAALELGVQIALARAKDGVEVVGCGEVGIGNTTPSAAIIAAFTKQPAAVVTGRGTGLDDRGLAAKIHIINEALTRVSGRTDPLDIARALGGLEILAMAGFMIGSASQRVPIVIDGVIAAAAAVVAHALRPDAKDYLVASHRSTEPGIVAALDHLKLRPLVELEMRLGEGTGSVIGIALLRAAVAVSNEMATFASAGLI